jgi:hypothetical protein
MPEFRRNLLPPSSLCRQGSSFLWNSLFFLDDGGRNFLQIIDMFLQTKVNRILEYRHLNVHFLVDRKPFCPLLSQLNLFLTWKRYCHKIRFSTILSMLWLAKRFSSLFWYAYFLRSSVVSHACCMFRPPSKLAQPVTPVTCICKVPGSSLDRHTDYYDWDLYKVETRTKVVSKLGHDRFLHLFSSSSFDVV